MRILILLSVLLLSSAFLASGCGGDGISCADMVDNLFDSGCINAHREEKIFYCEEERLIAKNCGCLGEFDAHLRCLSNIETGQWAVDPDRWTANRLG